MGRDYVLVERSELDKYFSRLDGLVKRIETIALQSEWDKIVAPTTKEVATYLGISTSKIYADIEKGCALKKAKEGGIKGRGSTLFFKSSVEDYKLELERKKIKV